MSRSSASPADCSPGSAALFFLAYNGAFAGALAGYLTERGLSSTFYSFVATHSAFELTAIVLSGAAGLRIGHALLAPGRLTRLQSLVQATRGFGGPALRRDRDAARRRRHRGVLVVGELARRRRSSTASPRSAGPPCSATSRSRDAVQVDALAVRLRPRTPIEAADLGVRLCQSAARSVYPLLRHRGAARDGPCRWPPIELASWLPGLVIWCAKPWLDRTILFVLSRAAFGQRTTPADVWRAQRQVWWSQLLFTWTVRRLSPWRSLTQPVYQLEGLSILKARARVRQIRRRNTGSAPMMTQAFYASEAGLTIAMLSLVFWFAPSGRTPDLPKCSAVGTRLVRPSLEALEVLFRTVLRRDAGFCALYPMPRKAGGGGGGGG